jgi:hypothetical protein
LQYDDEGGLITSEDEEKRFLEARAWDHLMTPFQCDQCHFRNIYNRDPLTGDLQDEEAIEFIRQAVIDTFWSREPSPVKSNLYEAQRGARSAKRFGFPEGSATPPTGPFPLSDEVGMKAAIVVLDRSLDPGKYSDYVQWETFRKARSAITNVSQAGATGLLDVIGAYERNWSWISKVPTHTFWFHRFMVGIHKRVGEQIRRQDEALSIAFLHAVDRILEARWRATTDALVHRRVAEMGTWFCGGFCTGLRGKEMVRIAFSGTVNSMSKWMDKGLYSYFMFVVSRRSKGNQISGSKFSVPCVAVTEGTNLRPGHRLGRLVGILKKVGIRAGRLF